jgi:2-polyprenyl-3-methyl-5-hydroxy-6-metoxy-1,4-benzoquinol methylase
VAGREKETATNTPCQICGGTDCPLFIRHDGMALFRCRACGLVFLDPPPSPAEITGLYADTYRGATESYFRKPEIKLRRARVRMRRIVSYFSEGVSGRTFLDVGANGGFMVETARQAGFAALGIEPDAHAVAYAREHFPAGEYINATLEDADLGQRRFDAVYCSEVIEHVADANRFLAKLARHMAPGGILYLTTPDIDHWRRPRDIRRWDAFCPPAHCLYFNRRNLARLLAKHGLTVVYRLWALKPGVKLIARREGAGAGGRDRPAG